MRGIRLLPHSGVGTFALCAIWMGSFFFDMMGTPMICAAQDQSPAARGTLQTEAGEGMAHMAGHMYMTALRPPAPGDQERADAVVAAARKAISPYADYRKALADGYRIFLPNIPQPQYHFTKRANALEAMFRFDPDKPTSLLYRKTDDGGYVLIGAMYTDRVNASEDELNERIPLSIARWHQHINFCKAPPGQLAAYFGPDAKFGLLGSITTKDACDAAGASSIRMSLGGWCMCIRLRAIPRKSGRCPTTAEGMTIWITPRCPA